MLNSFTTVTTTNASNERFVWIKLFSWSSQMGDDGWSEQADIKHDSNLKWPGLCLDSGWGVKA